MGEPTRYAPYARPSTGSKNNYHWHTVCAVRNSMMEAYDAVYTLHDRVRDGATVGERDIQRILSMMGDMLTCGVCGKVVPRLDNSCFVARCGHVYHKGESGCWDKAGRICHLPDCRRGDDAPRIYEPPRQS